jgi:hypothetical protein
MARLPWNTSFSILVCVPKRGTRSLYVLGHLSGFASFDVYLWGFATIDNTLRRSRQKPLTSALWGIGPGVLS